MRNMELDEETSDNSISRLFLDFPNENTGWMNIRRKTCVASTQLIMDWKSRELAMNISPNKSNADWGDFSSLSQTCEYSKYSLNTSILMNFCADIICFSLKLGYNKRSPKVAYKLLLPHDEKWWKFPQIGWEILHQYRHILERMKSIRMKC